MSVIVTQGVIQQGRVELEEPVDLPDGTRVSSANSESLETEINSDQAWDNSPEGVADWLKW